jgi:hypothetical protein
MLAPGGLAPDGGLRLRPGVPPVARLQFSASLFLDRLSALYGPSNTGKTLAVKNAILLLAPHVNQIVVVSPTEVSNRAYEGFVDPACIHSRPYLPDPEKPEKDDGAKGVVRFMETIWKRQEALVQTYEAANRRDVLMRLFQRIPRRHFREGMALIRAIDERRKRAIHRISARAVEAGTPPGRRSEEIKGVNDAFERILVATFKRFIAPHFAELWAEPLPDDERLSLQYLEFNPRLLLILDDCAAELKPHFKKDIFRKFFYQGRHCKVTTLLVFQDDTDLDANLRKNAFVSIYTDPIVCSANFERKSNNFAKATVQYALEAIPRVFVKNRKLAYIRDDPSRKHFYHVEYPVPEPPKEPFGGAATRELLEEVRATGATFDRKNPYFERLAVAGRR